MAKKAMVKKSLIPVQVKWEEEGVKVEGALLSKEETMYRDAVRGRYLITTLEGLRVVLGTYQIDQALRLVEEGEVIGIEYLGEEGTGSGNKFKTFNIWVEEGEEVELSPPVTDNIKPRLAEQQPA